MHKEFNTIEELEAEYKSRQQEIVDDRKKGVFATEEEDRQKQADVWFWYMAQEFLVTRDPQRLRNYLHAIFESKYVQTRDAYWNGEINRKKYINRVEQAMDEYEKPLIELGVLEHHTSKKLRKSAYEGSFEVEKRFLKKDKKRDMKVLQQMCKEQNKFGHQYTEGAIMEAGKNISNKFTERVKKYADV